MAGEELQVIRLRDDFYRDGFYKILLSLGFIIVAILFLVALSIYLYVTKPSPVNFAADNEWRILKPVPIDQIYLATPDLIQWASEVLPSVFTYDFLHYTKQQKEAEHYFTSIGWQKYLTQLSIYANSNTMETAKQFVNAHAAGAPFILNQGLLEGRYGWWVQMPININYISVDKSSTIPIIVQVLIVRVSTLNNLQGVAIENIVITKGAGDQVLIHG